MYKEITIRNIPDTIVFTINADGEKIASFNYLGDFKTILPILEMLGENKSKQEIEKLFKIK